MVDCEIIEDYFGGVFSYSFLLVFKFLGCEFMVGDVILYFSFDIIFSCIEVGVFFFIGNVLVKIIFLVFLFMIVFCIMFFELL